MPPRSRHIVDTTSRPALAAHVRLTFNELRGKWAVLAPEKVLWPDEVSADILKRCTGDEPISKIVADLAEDYDAPADQIAPDVLAFVQEWSDRLLIRCSRADAEATG